MPVLVCLLVGLNSLLLAGWTGGKVNIYDRSGAREIATSNWYLGDSRGFVASEIRPGEWFLPLPGAWLWPGLRLIMAGGVPLAAEVSGHSLWTGVPLPTTAHLLALAGISMGPEDRMESNLGSDDPHQYIRVIRVDNTIELRQEPVAPPLVRRPERTLRPGEEKVVQEGQPGVRY
ncbi:MAG: G5 domain-containing protein, partial [Moorella sp. (in: Bacteria)]|nr:G5 domain-containing protein [Moorella sp. (in: firmicutes)]